MKKYLNISVLSCLANINTTYSIRLLVPSTSDCLRLYTQDRKKLKISKRNIRCNFKNII